MPEPIEIPAKSSIDPAYEKWKKDPTPSNMHGVLEASDPLIRSQVLHLSGSSNPAVHTEAKSLAVQAVRTFDPSYGVKLTTHISNQLHPIKRISSKYDTDLKIPERVQSDWYHIHQEEQAFTEENSRKPSTQELADRMGLSFKRIAHVRDTARGVMSEGQLAEGVPLGIVTPSQLSTAAEYVYQDLPAADQRLMELRLGYGGHVPVSTEEIARELGVSASIVSNRSAEISRRILDTERLL